MGVLMQGKQDYINKQTLRPTRKVISKHKQTMSLSTNHHEHTHEQLSVHERSWFFSMAVRHQIQDFLFIYNILELPIMNFNTYLIISMIFWATFSTVAIKKNWMFGFWNVNWKKNGKKINKSFKSEKLGKTKHRYLMWLKVIRIINKYCKSHFFSFLFLEKGFRGRKGKEVFGGVWGGLGVCGFHGGLELRPLSFGGFP
jgi:hypothetical protein